MLKQKMVIVEDDPKLQKMLQIYFEKENFDTSIVSDGNAASDIILSNQPDIVLLDLMLPGQDGLTICRQIRSQYYGKILMLTASDDDFDHVASLEIGADDFVTKPIKLRVLLSRVRVLLRRSNSVSLRRDASVIQIGNLELIKSQRLCKVNGQEVLMTDREFDLLWMLASSEGVLSRDVLTKALRGIEYNGIDRSVDNRILNLRKKLGDDSIPPKKIITIRGKGYMFIPEAWL